MMEFSKLNLRTWPMLGKRGTFGAALTSEASSYNNLFVVTADFTKSSGLGQFKLKYPEKFLNVGIAEQNLVGVASGIASEGFNVFATSFASFITTRSYEQVKINCGYMRQNIKIVGLAAGFGVELQGNTHYGLDDICLMRAIPGLTIISPADCSEVVKSVEALVKYDGPVYLRLCGERGDAVVYNEDYDFEIGKGILLRQGADVTIIATGTMVSQSMKMAKCLSDKGIECNVIDLHTIRPIDNEIIKATCSDVNHVFTIEEGFITGGMGCAVQASMTSMNIKTPLTMFGVEGFPHPASYATMLEQTGLSIGHITNRILKIIE